MFALGDVADADLKTAGRAGREAEVVVANIRALIEGGELQAYEPIAAGDRDPARPERRRLRAPGPATRSPAPRRPPRSRASTCSSTPTASASGSPRRSLPSAARSRDNARHEPPRRSDPARTRAAGCSRAAGRGGRPGGRDDAARVAANRGQRPRREDADSARRADPGRTTRRRRSTRPPAAAAAAGGATVGTCRRPATAVRPITRNFTNCNEAVDWLNGGGDAGDASPQYHPTAGGSGTRASGGYVHGFGRPDVGLRPVLDGRDDHPGLAEHDRRRARRGRELPLGDPGARGDALRRHRHHRQGPAAHGHGDGNRPGRRRRATCRRRSRSTGRTLRRRSRLATHDYDATTQHGKTQSAVGGVDVHLDCSGGGGSGGGGAGGGGSSSVLDRPTRVSRPT